MTWVMRIGAVLLILAGLTWLLQGLGMLKGSVMSGSSFWAIMGVICLLAGAFLAYRSFLAARPKL